MRRRIAYVLPAAALAVLALALVATAESGNKGQGKRAKKAAHASLKSANGSAVAKVRLVERPNGKVAVLVRARGLRPGFHGFHVHEKGPASHPPSRAPAGTTSEVVEATESTPGTCRRCWPRRRKARAQFVTDSFHIRQLVARDGSAVMIHAGRDDLANIPTRYKSVPRRGQTRRR